MSKKPLTRLSPEVEELAFDMILDGKKLDEIFKAMGFKSRISFQKYCMAHPEFTQLLERAKIAECVFIEEEIRYCADKYLKDDARIKLESLSRLLKWRDQKKYGDKTQIDMSVTVDISGSLERAESRVIDVHPVNLIPLIQKKTEIE